ncbi:MAG: DUF5596 domain-containing protein [Fimbriimonadaceae bacterium]|nr:DUF5596 domain-containing protein [Fimbriimonadaceae bacterium]
MTIAECCAAAAVPEAAVVLETGWESSRATCPAVPFFLDPAFIATAREQCGQSAAHQDELLATAAVIRADRALTLLAWHCHRLLFELLDYQQVQQWPALTARLGDQAGQFYLLVALSEQPAVWAQHAALGVPREVTLETLRQVTEFTEFYRRMTGGRLGVPQQNLYWLRHYTAGRLYRLGRFEYMIRPYGHHVEFWRRTDGLTVALANDGLRFTVDGYRDASAEHHDDWVSQLTVTAEAVSGHPIDPRGWACRQRLTLPTTDWRRVLADGDAVLDLHIPAGGAMTPERAVDSLRRAAEFFARQFPETPCRAIASGSWIYGNMLEQIRLSSTNLVDFQRELYLLPIPSNPTSGLWFVYQGGERDLANLPRHSSLQRGVADFLAAGGTWRVGGMTVLVDDLPHLGRQHYRTAWLQAGGLGVA